MAQVPYDTRSTWQWGEEVGSGIPDDEETRLPGSFEKEEEVEADEQDEEPMAQEAPDQDIPHHDGTDHNPRPRRYYSPRKCRICLEEVNPSFELPPEGIPSMFTPNPKVQYISEDPESGRLISPCKCTGTSRYVHEGCLQQWRLADTRQRNYWECPTCKFKYHLQRMAWGRWLSSTFLQLSLTILIMFALVFFLGFVADPIINLYLDPYDTITSLPSGGLAELSLEDDDASWASHFLKGTASLGLLGCVQAFFVMSPWQWWNLRQSGVLGGGGRGRRGTGRDRLENISWTLVVIGIGTFLYTVWKFIRSWSRRTLENASERVVDVQTDDDYEEFPPTDDDGNETDGTNAGYPSSENPEIENRKTQ